MESMFRKTRPGALLAVMAIVALLMSVPLFAASAHAAELAGASGDALAQPVSAQAVKNGWSSDHEFYYRDGAKVTGLQKIDGKRYYFRSNGRLRHKDFEVQGVKYFLDDDSSILGLKLYGKYYYDTLKPMTDADAYDFDTYIWARDIVHDLSDSNDMPWDKLRKAFMWVVNQGYAIHQDFSPYQENWMAVYARYHFMGNGGDCHSDGAAMAYLAATIGYNATVAIDSWGTGYAPSHCWAMVDGAVYDPLFYEAKSTMYYGATSGTYETNPTAEFSVPTYSSSHADPNAKTPDEMLKAGYVGLKKLNGSYYYFKDSKPVKSKWLTISGKRYYFQKDGTAATGSTKIKGTYYVFNTKGQLQTSSKKGSRFVKVAGVTYHVNNKGQAVKGWTKNKKKYCLSNGRLVAGKQVVKGRFYVASKKGVYNKAKTHELRVASKAGKPAAKLYNLLGKPQEIVYSVNCEGMGYDGLYQYKNFIVTTIRPYKAHTAKYDAKRLKAGKKLPKTYEYVCTIEAR